MIVIIVGVVKTNEPNLLIEYGSHLELTDDWAKHLLKSIHSVKRKALTKRWSHLKKFWKEKNSPINVKSHELY